MAVVGRSILARGCDTPANMDRYLLLVALAVLLTCEIAYGSGRLHPIICTRKQCFNICTCRLMWLTGSRIASHFKIWAE